MRIDCEDSCTEDEDQSEKSNNVIPSGEKARDASEILRKDEIHAENMEAEKTEFESMSQKSGKNGQPVSYKNMLMGINGADYNESSEDSEMWDDEDSEEESFNEEFKDHDPLCPHINITTEERKLFKPWRKALIIKLLRRRIGYKFLYSRLSKLWNLSGNFELIDLQNKFFLVRFVEVVDYEQVLYDEPWMIIGHYLTVQRWKLEFKPFESTIKKIAVWIRIPDLPIEYYDKHFLWKARNMVGKTMKVDVHTIKENHRGGELNTTERGRFARISVEINLEKKLILRLKIRNRTYRIEYEGLNLICFTCGKYGHHRDTCNLQIQSTSNQNLVEEATNNEMNNATDSINEPGNQSCENEETFGSWMIVKRNSSNRIPNKQQTNKVEGRKTIPVESRIPGTNTQKPPTISGSRFAVFGVEEECEEDTCMVISQGEANTNGDIGEVNNLEKMVETSNMEIEGGVKLTSEANKDIQKREFQNIKRRTNDNVMKSKNIMEKFVKLNGGDKKKSIDSLKTSSSGSFKIQKPKKLSTQWGKAKPILLTPDLNKPSLTHDFIPPGFGEFILENRPSDPNKVMGKDNNSADFTHLAKDSKKEKAPSGNTSELSSKGSQGVFFKPGCI